MLRSLRGLAGYRVSAIDGELGEVIDVYFDDEHWSVRYLVVNTSEVWHGGHEVLISPNAFIRANWQDESISLLLTQDKIRNSPPVDLAKPVSRQYEQKYFQYYGWPYYWVYGLAPMLPPDKPANSRVEPHLYSVRDVTGYRIHASDGELGHVKDCIVDDETWTLRYWVIATRNWLGKNVLVAPRWIEKLDCDNESLRLNLPRQVVRNSPEWKPDEPINRTYEARLYDYYGRPAYWDDDTNEQPPRESNGGPRDTHTML